MVGKRKPGQVYRKTTKISGSGIEVVIGEIENVSPEHKSISINEQEYKGDYMIISLGTEQAIEHNLSNFGHNFYTLEGAARFYEQLEKFRGGNIIVLVPSLPFKCPAAPYEAAMLINGYIRKKGMAGQTEISVYTPEPGPMPVAGKKLSDAVRHMVEVKGIKYFPEHQLTSVTDKALTFNNGTVTNYDLLAFTPKHLCPSVIRQTSLCGKTGWIEVNRETLETNFPDIYAIGDITSIRLEMGRPLPKAGVFAHYQAETVARNITRKIKGKTPDKTFDGDGYCFLELGEGKAGFAGGNFYGSPLPVIKMKKPGYYWHWGKIWFEKSWFFRNFKY